MFNLLAHVMERGKVKILLVEDDEMIGEGLQQAMRTHAVYWVKNAMQAEQAIMQEMFDAILLDIGLPKKNGIEWLTEFRKAGNQTPVIVITARDAIEQRIEGLDAGADDYVLKPFAIEELEARLRAIFRRKEERLTNQLEVNGVILNTANYMLSAGAVSQRLSAKAFAIMYHLMSQPGMIFSKSQLEEKLYGWGEEIDSNAVEVHVHHIRKKFGPDIIQTIRGIGYAFPDKKEK